MHRKVAKSFVCTVVASLIITSQFTDAKAAGVGPYPYLGCSSPLSGTWNATEVADENACGEGTNTYRSIVVIREAQGQVRISDKNGTAVGSRSGCGLNMSGWESEDEGYSRGAGKLTLSADGNLITGSGGWTWKGPGPDNEGMECSGTSKITLNRRQCPNAGEGKIHVDTFTTYFGRATIVTGEMLESVDQRVSEEGKINIYKRPSNFIYGLNLFDPYAALDAPSSDIYQRTGMKQTLNFESKPFEMGFQCFHVNKIRVDLVAWTRTFINRCLLPTDSCPYKVVFHHEKFHAEIDKSALERHAKVFFAEKLGSNPWLPSPAVPIVARDNNDAMRIITPIMDAVWREARKKNSIIKPFLADVARKEWHQQLDSGEQAVREEAMCRKWPSGIDCALGRGKGKGEVNIE